MKWGKMMASELLNKLRLKGGQKAAVINAPEGYIGDLGPLPENTRLFTELDGTFDFIHLFVSSRSDLESLGTAVTRAINPDGLLWISYPKKSSKVKTDLTRDTGRDVMHKAGFEAVSQVSVNETWSALRFRPSEKVKRSTRK
ncbi:MAG: hypothetical protein ACYC4H_12650 [Desulfocucumaceae bacterium]